MYELNSAMQEFQANKIECDQEVFAFEWKFSLQERRVKSGNVGNCELLSKNMVKDVGESLVKLSENISCH